MALQQPHRIHRHIRSTSPSECAEHKHQTPFPLSIKIWPRAGIKKRSSSCHCLHSKNTQCSPLQLCKLSRPPIPAGDRSPFQVRLAPSLLWKHMVRPQKVRRRRDHSHCGERSWLMKELLHATMLRDKAAAQMCRLPLIGLQGTALDLSQSAVAMQPSSRLRMGDGSESRRSRDQARYLKIQFTATWWLESRINAQV